MSSSSARTTPLTSPAAARSSRSGTPAPCATRGHDVWVYAGSLSLTVPPTRSTRPGCRSAGSRSATRPRGATRGTPLNRAVGGGLRAYLQQARAGRGAPALAAGHGRRAGAGRQAERCPDGRDDARLLVVLRAAVPRRQGLPAVQPRRRGWGLRLRGRPPLAGRAATRGSPSALAAADVVCAPVADRRRRRPRRTAWPTSCVVDENGLPPQAIDPGERHHRRPVRFLYAGGKNRLKGVQCLLEATQLLPGGGWSLTVFGSRARRTWPAAGDRPNRPTTRTGCRTCCTPTTCWCFPSLMRESFSILTREALQHGLAVITSDSLGPEEVISHGVNGLVVATGDADGPGRCDDAPDRRPRRCSRGCAAADPPTVRIARRPGRRTRAALRRAAAPRGDARGEPRAVRRAASRAHRCATARSCRPRRSPCVGITSDVRRLPRPRAASSWRPRPTSSCSTGFPPPPGSSADPRGSACPRCSTSTT